MKTKSILLISLAFLSGSLLSSCFGPAGRAIIAHEIREDIRDDRRDDRHDHRHDNRHDDRNEHHSPPHR